MFIFRVAHQFRIKCRFDLLDAAVVTTGLCSRLNEPYQIDTVDHALNRALSKMNFGRNDLFVYFRYSFGVILSHSKGLSFTHNFIETKIDASDAFGPNLFSKQR